MKKICVLSLLFSLVSFSKGYVETYGKVDVEGSGLHVIENAGVKLNMEQDKLKFTANIGLKDYNIKTKKYIHFDKKDVFNYPSYVINGPDYNSIEDIKEEYYNYGKDYGGMFNYRDDIKKNVKKASNFKLEYAALRDEKADVTLSAESDSYDLYNCVLKSAKLGSNLTFKFSDKSKFGIDNEIELYDGHTDAYISPHVETQIKNKANIKFGVGLGYTDMYRFGNCLYITTDLNGKVRLNKNTTLEMYNSVNVSLNNVFLKMYKKRLGFFGLGNDNNLEYMYEKEENGYLRFLDIVSHGIVCVGSFIEIDGADRGFWPKKMLKSSLNLKNKSDNFEMEIMPFANFFVGQCLDHVKGAFYGVNAKASNKFLDKYLIGTKIKLFGLDHLYEKDDDGIYFMFTKIRGVNMDFYTEYDAKINSKFSVKPKLEVGYYGKHESSGLANENGNGEYVLHRLKGEASILAKYMITDSLSMSAGILGGLKFVKGNYKMIQENGTLYKGENEVLNKYLKLSFNMKYEWR
jgi:hypothetical protein